eukprot:5435083-Pyramimonas_sp.AAC.1
MGPVLAIAPGLVRRHRAMRPSTARPHRGGPRQRLLSQALRDAIRGASIGDISRLPAGARIFSSGALPIVDASKRNEVDEEYDEDEDGDE